MKLISYFRLRAILFALACLAVCACSLIQPKGGPGSGSSSSSSSSSEKTTAFTPSSDARKDLGDALRKLKTAYPYRLTETMSATGSGPSALPASTRMVEFAAPDRSHMKWTSVTGGPGGDLEHITIGEKGYSYSGGKWAEESGPSMAQRVKRGQEFENKLAEMIKEVKYVGPESVNGVPCHAYTYTMEVTLSGQRYVGMGKAWIGAADGLPHQNDSEVKVANYEQKSHIVYEYNVNFKIEKPPI